MTQSNENYETVDAKELEDHVKELEVENSYLKRDCEQTKRQLDLFKNNL